MNTADVTHEGQPKARPLNKEDYKTLALSSLGGTLEFYDFVICALYVDKVIIGLFLPDDMNAFTQSLLGWGIVASAYIARPLGGIIMAHFGDTIGRKRMFTLSVAMMALPTFAIGLLPTYATLGVMAPILLLCMRILQGAAIGGEMPGAWVFIAEHTPSQRYGLGIGILTSGITGGILLGFIALILIKVCFTDQQALDYAWRIPFIVGGLFGVISVYLRRYLKETPIFKEMAARKELSKQVPIVNVLKSHKFACVVVFLLTWTLSTTVMVGVLMTPTAILKARYGFDELHASIGGCIVALTLTIGCVVFGWLEDKLRTRMTMTIAWGGLAISALTFFAALHTGLSVAGMMTLYGIMGLFCGAITLTPIVGTRAFPPSIRFSGLSFSYNVAYAIFSAITPQLTLYLLNPNHILGSYSYMGAGFYIAAVSLLAIAVAYLPLAYRGWTTQVKLNLAASPVPAAQNAVSS